MDVRGDSPAVWAQTKDGGLCRSPLLAPRRNLPFGILAHGDDVVGTLVVICDRRTGELPAFSVGRGQAVLRRRRGVVPIGAGESSSWYGKALLLYRRDYR